MNWEPDFEVFVRGHRPAPQGSKRHVGKGVLIEQSKRVKPWRQAVCDAIGTPPETLDGPLAVQVVFTVSKPTTAPKNRVTYPATRSSGDLDKLLRSTFDALSDSGTIADDSRIIDVRAIKVYPGEHREALDEPGAIIRVWKTGNVNDH